MENIDRGVLEKIINYEIIPLLKEYWFDEIDKVKSFSIRLREALS